MMRNISKKAAFQMTAVAGVSLLATAAIAPGAIAAGTVSGDVKVSNTETVQVLMDASGKVASQRVYEQLELTGKGNVDIANPVSTQGLRNLDGFGGYDVRDGKVRVKTAVDGTKNFRSVSDFTKKLPLDISIGYFFDGKKVEPGDVVGKSGDLEVRYRVTNNTGVTQDVPFKDGMGADMTKPESVVIPMVGTLTTTLPSNFTKVQSAEASAAGDGRGGTSLTFTMTLFPPIGKNFADFGYHAHVTDGIIPKANISALPVNPLESPSFKGGAESYKGGATTGADLTAGATEIDANVIKLRDGANDLVAGILKLQDGASQLSTGLNNDAVPGAKKVAAGAVALNDGAVLLSDGTFTLKKGAIDLKTGATKVSAGAEELAAGLKTANAGGKLVAGGAGQVDDGAIAANAGAGQIAAGLAEASGKAPALLDGIDQLSAGANLVDAGLLKLQGAVDAGVGSPAAADTLRNGIAKIQGGISTALNPQLDTASTEVGNASGYLAEVTDTTKRAELGAILTKIGTAVATAKAIVNGPLPAGATSIMAGLSTLDSGLQQLNGKVAAAVGTPNSTVPDPVTGIVGPSLRNGMAQLIGGLAKMKVDAGPLVSGLGELSTGAAELSTGTGKLVAGTGELKAGAVDLSNGLNTKLVPGASELAGGAGQVADGTGELKAGALKLDAGAGTLKDGTGALSAGAGLLSGGLGTAAAGSNLLADGLNQAAASAPALPEGADRLSKEGTKKLIAAGDATASDYGLKYALIAAGADRAATAQPYGSPEGATQLTAYSFDLAGADGTGSANVKRGLAAIVLLAGAAGVAAIRRV